MATFFGNVNQGGDIWNMAGINFGSNLTDILEKEDFTLEEILVEDDLLQEVKSRNPTLIQFLSEADTIEAMVKYVTVRPEEDVTDELLYRYPYMSCEIFCCEVPSVLEVLIESEDGKYFTQLLSALDLDPPLNHYLAGYLEKILDMLFRQMTIPVMSYLNKGGIALFEKFLKHIDNYSIMQIVQRLMLPHIPFSLETADVDLLSPEQKENCTCDWSFLPETCGLLIDRMLSFGCHPDIPTHVSELLITAIQLSPPDAPFLSNLCEEKCLKPLVSHIWNPSYGGEAPNDFIWPEEDRCVMESKSLAVSSVLDSLMSRMREAYDPSYVAASDECDSPRRRNSHGSIEGVSNPLLLAAARIAEGNATGELSGTTDAALHSQIQQRVRENMGYICRDILPIIPKIGEMLKSHFVDTSSVLCAAQAATVAKVEEDKEETESSEMNTDVPERFILHQTKFPFCRLGHHGFRLVKLTESIVRLADPAVDEVLVSSGTLGACIKLMFQYELHSLLHLSVQRIAVMIIEGGESRRLAQKSILIDSGLIHYIIETFEARSGADETWNGNVDRFANCTKPIVGHVLCIAQVLVRTLHIETPEGIKEARDSLEDSMLTLGSDEQDSGGDHYHHEGEAKGDGVWSVVEDTAHLGNQPLPRSLPSTLMRTIIEDAGLADKWDSFVDNEYKKATDVQLTGGHDNASVYSASDAGVLTIFVILIFLKNSILTYKLYRVVRRLMIQHKPTWKTRCALWPDIVALMETLLTGGLLGCVDVNIWL